ncbi:MAG: YbbR-like domain-containing protein [Deltaproteobacteria bacterium]|nr:YbbR-like domain-containing protein [Deltaproteobacteria bacterium]MBW2417773.1 YbbR-like domain-containing protein [Deltaproteobacteria bacterium]
MSRQFSNLRPGMLLVALVIAVILWGIAHGSSSKERAYDVPIEIDGLSDELVVTDRDPDEINMRIMGSAAALRNIDANALRYRVDVTGSKPGDAEYEVDVSRVETDLPRGARVVSRSPSRILLRFEPRGRKAVAVRVDLEGEPPPGFVLGEVQVEPARVWITGARSQVLRLSEVVTETVELGGLKETTEREVSLFLGAGTVWMEKKEPVKIVIHIEPEPAPELETLEPALDEGAQEETEPS